MIKLRNPFRRRDYDRFEGPGFVMERKGRFMRMVSTLNARGHAERRKNLGKSVESLRQDMLRQIEELYSILHRYQPECVLGALWFREAPKSHSDASHLQGKHESALAHVEYLATLYLRNRGPGTEFVLAPRVLEDISRRVTSLFDANVWLWMAEDAARYGDKEADAARDLWFMTLTHSLYVRYPGYFDQLKEMLLGIETEMAQHLSLWLGWGIRDAVAVGDAIIALVDERLNVSLARGAQEAEKMQDAAWPRGRGVIARIVKHYLPPHRRPWNRKQLYLLSAWVMFLIQDATTFTVEELATASGVEQSRVAALMRAASLSWGECQEDYYLFPHPTPPIITRPCINLGDDGYLVPVPTSFTWAIRGLVEETLKSLDTSTGTNRWNAYERARASFTEREAIRILSGAFPQAGAFHSLKYSWDKDGVTLQGELDGLLLADHAAVLVEVKAGALSPEARRGAPDRLRDQLRELVGKAHAQALKAKEFLKSAPSVVFQLNAREGLEVQSTKFREIVLVAINLDPLPILTTNLMRLADLGVLGPTDLPWAVSYFELCVIVDVLEFPAQLLQYIRRRQRVNDLGFIQAVDELDWFGHYLTEGLYFEHLPKGGKGKYVMSIVGYSDIFDAHYMHDERSSGERPPKPRQVMPEPMREMLRELDKHQEPGHLELSLALLDLDSKTRDYFFNTAEDLVSRSRADGTNHDLTLILNDGQNGLTFMSDIEPSALKNALVGYCQMKKYQCRCSSWVGIGKLASSDRCVDVAVVIEHPWEYDEKLEALVAAAEEAIAKQKAGSARRAKHDGTR
jgi:hypothetical protein